MHTYDSMILTSSIFLVLAVYLSERSSKKEEEEEEEEEEKQPSIFSHVHP